MDKIVIKTEGEAFAALQRALDDKVPIGTIVEFEGWPVFKLRISGEDFHGSIPTRIMPSILELQKEIHRVYCRSKYNTENTRVLRQDEKEMLELVVEIKTGSTEFVTELSDALNEIIKNSNMNGEQALILLVSISAMLVGGLAWKNWLAHKEREHGQDVSVQLSQEETKRLEIVSQAKAREPSIEQNHQAIETFRSNLSKKLKPEDSISVDQQEIVTGERASEIVNAPRELAQEVRIDDEFIINEVKFPKVYGGKYRFSVTRTADRKQLMVDAHTDVLSAEQISVLKDGGFGVKSVLMEINARSLRGHISAARLVSISWPDSPPESKNED